MRHTQQTIAFMPTAVKAAKPYRGKRAEYRLREAKGGARGAVLEWLVLEVRPNGKRSWRVHYDLRHDGQRVRRKPVIGDDATALDIVRARWKAIKDAVDAGHDWVAEEDARRRTARRAEAVRFTFRDLANAYIARHAKPKKRTWRDDQNKLNRYVLDDLGDLSLSEIGKRDVIRVLDAIAYREEAAAPVQADRVKALLSSIFNWGISEALAETNPAARLKPRSEPVRRTRVYSPEEIRLVWPRLAAGAASEVQWRARAVLRLTFLLGQRLTQISAARKTEIKGLGTKRPIWEVPKLRNKNKEEMHLVPLPPMAAAILAEAIARSGDSEFVFPSAKSGAPINRSTVYLATREECGALGIEGTAVHDTRHTLKTNLAKLGIAKDTRDRITSHKSATANMSSWYDHHDYEPEMRRALEAWEGRLQDFIKGGETGGNVVALRTA